MKLLDLLQDPNPGPLDFTVPTCDVLNGLNVFRLHNLISVKRLYIYIQ